jgi:polyisoprenoid-binding protein YceI
MTALRCSFLVAFLLLPSIGSAELQTIRSDREGTTITYRLIHPLHEIEATSREVDCLLTLDRATKDIHHVVARVGVMTFNSGNSNRDSHAMEVIDALSYPEAMFTSTSIEQTGDSVRVSGTLTFHGVTRDVVLPAALQWSGDRLVAHGTLHTTLSAFNIEPPSLLMIPVQDELDFTIVGMFLWGEKGSE